MKVIAVDPARCAGCANCMSRCSKGLIRVVGKIARIRVEECDLCGRCVDACNYCALSIEEIPD